MKRVISIALILCSLKYISLYAQTVGMYSTALIIHEAEPDEKANTEEYKVLDIEENTPIPYNVPLDEIAEKIEHVYAYDNMVPLKTEAWWSAEYLYGELGALPEGEDVLISVYSVKGNRLLFLPEDKANTEIVLNGTPCKMYYSEKEEGYLFYALIDWLLVDDGVPVNYCEGYYDYGIMSCIVGVKEVPEPHVINYYYQTDYQYEINDLVKLGEVRVSFNPNAAIELPEIPIDGNAYIDAVLEYMADVLRKEQQFGSYEVYLETYGRLDDKYGESTYSQITGAITGNGLEEFFFFQITDGWGYLDKECVFPAFYSGAVDESTYFVNHSYMVNKPEDLVQRIIGLQRETVHLEVTKEAGEETKAAKSAIPDYNSDIDFRTMSAEEADEWINYVYSYGECFGMNELGYQAGELRKYSGDDILMYTRNNTGDTIYFIPKSMTNTTIVDGNGQEYHVHVNKDENVKFYCLERNRYADKDGQLRTKLFTECYLSTEAVKDSILIGEGKLQLLELSLLDVPEVAEDEYVTATKEYVEDILKQNEKSGRYEMYIGEYEALFMNEVCLSVALLNEEDAYYFRYMIVKNGEENYYFWPIGFGLNGSLEECAGDRHYMNKVCIERTKQLERSEFVLDITQSLPETVWEETITYKEQVYLAAFERISPASETLSDLYGGYADYQLVVKDENGNIVSSQILTNYPITLEEVYWFKDISGDDFPDVILCSSYVEGNGNRFTNLIFLIWNNEKLIYESKPLPWDKSLDGPVWNEELSSIIFAYIDDEVNMEMFTYKDGEWSLSGKCAVESETEKENGNIEFVCGEYFYKDNQIIKNEIKVTVPEQNLPWHDDNSIWGGTHNVQNEWLFPDYGNWNTIDKELEGGRTVWKYTRNDHNVIQ